MSNILNRNFELEVARGNVTGQFAVNKFGRSTNVDNGVSTDIWDAADVTTNQAIWLAPTAARLHDIASDSTSDDGSPVGVGARTLKIYGLQTWSSVETNETITMDGTTNVTTANSYVIIHRMVVITWGATSVNVGTITATAQTDATLTAQISPSKGQTEMAIYGIPTSQKFYMYSFYVYYNKSAGVSGAIDSSILCNSAPNSITTRYITKHTQGGVIDGTSGIVHDFKVPKIFEGPCIIKIQSVSSVNNVDVSAGFDGILINN